MSGLFIVYRDGYILYNTDEKGLGMSAIGLTGHEIIL